MAVEGGSSTSRSLLLRAAEQSPDAWQNLVSLYSPLVMHWCRRLGLRAQDAADVSQDVFQEVVRHIKRFRKEKPGDTFRGWLHRITQNKVRDFYRRRARQPQAPGGSEALGALAAFPAESLDGSSVADADGTTALLRCALARVRRGVEPATWQAFWRSAVEGRPATEVGQELGLTPGAVRVAKCRVLQRLRCELGEVDDSPSRA